MKLRFVVLTIHLISNTGVFLSDASWLDNGIPTCRKEILQFRDLAQSVSTSVCLKWCYTPTVIKTNFNFCVCTIRASHVWWTSNLTISSPLGKPYSMYCCVEGYFILTWCVKPFARGVRFMAYRPAGWTQNSFNSACSGLKRGMRWYVAESDDLSTGCTDSSVSTFLCVEMSGAGSVSGVAFSLCTSFLIGVLLSLPMMSCASLAGVVSGWVK